MNSTSVDLSEVSSDNCCIKPDLEAAGGLKYFLTDKAVNRYDPQILKTVKGFNDELLGAPPTQLVAPNKRKLLLIRRKHALFDQS